jgi:hypothetical protein
MIVSELGRALLAIACIGILTSAVAMAVAQTADYGRTVIVVTRFAGVSMFIGVLAIAGALFA